MIREQIILHELEKLHDSKSSKWILNIFRRGFYSLWIPESNGMIIRGICRDSIIALMKWHNEGVFEGIIDPIALKDY
jgi:branched-subunit amino acid aminotransferase/4-amino-4-deoxychorismate lyase